VNVEAADEISEDLPKVDKIDLGDSLPSLILKNEKEEDVDIATLTSEKGVILFLVPKADTRKLYIKYLICQVLIVPPLKLDVPAKHVVSETFTRTSLL
jgi:hypothetical protein